MVVTKKMMEQFGAKQYKNYLDIYKQYICIYMCVF